MVCLVFLEHVFFMDWVLPLAGSVDLGRAVCAVLTTTVLKAQETQIWVPPAPAK